MIWIRASDESIACKNKEKRADPWGMLTLKHGVKWRIDKRDWEEKLLLGKPASLIKKKIHTHTHTHTHIHTLAYPTRHATSFSCLCRIIALVCHCWISTPKSVFNRLFLVSPKTNGWYHRLDGHEFEQALGVGDGQGSLACCSPRGRKESDMTDWTELNLVSPEIFIISKKGVILICSFFMVG